MFQPKVSLVFVVTFSLLLSLNLSAVVQQLGCFLVGGDLTVSITESDPFPPSQTVQQPDTDSTPIES